MTGGLFFGFGGFFLDFGTGFAGFVAEVLFELGSFPCASFEAVDATFGVDDLFLAGEEGVGGGGDLGFDQGVFVAIGPFDGFVRLGGRPSEERKVGLLVHKNDRAIVFGVN